MVQQADCAKRGPAMSLLNKFMLSSLLVPALSCSCCTPNFGKICCACCKQLLHAVKSEARKAEQETYSLISEEKLLHEQVALEDRGIKSAPTPVRACLLVDCKLQPHLCHSSSACGSADKATRRPAARKTIHMLSADADEKHSCAAAAQQSAMS